jgi:RecB family exonuclease
MLGAEDSSSMSTVAVSWVRDTRAWARVVADLPTTGPLPARTVLIPSERVAHALRRELLLMGRPDVLPGTLFLSGVAAAQAVLREAGLSFRLGEEDLRPVRLARMFAREDLGLKHFPVDLLRTAQGWDDAFAKTIGECERAGLSSVDLEADPHPALRDLGHVWALLDQEADASWTAARALGEASAVVSDKTWPFAGATLAAVTGHESAVHARFVRAIPSVKVALREARPYRAEHLERLRLLFGIDVATPPTAPAPSSARERDLLAAYLFEPPEATASASRKWSSGPDDPSTVALEEHAGIESEIEAAADWVAQRVLAGTPLEDIAVLTPGNRDLADRASERLQRLPWKDGLLPVFLAEGRPAATSAAGARIMAIVRALRAWLSAEALAGVLPSLNAPSENRKHLSRDEAIDVVYSLGTLGGSPASPAGALTWKDRLAAADERLAARVARAGRITDPEELAREERDHGRTKTLLTNLRAARPAIEALCDVAPLIVNARPLTELWPPLRAFLETHVRMTAGPPLPVVIESALGPLLDDHLSATLAGDDAAHAIEEALDQLTLSDGRFGEPAVYVGSLASAAGVPFRAVRVIGMCEGALPSVPREDPVLPLALLADLAARVPAARLVSTPSERALAQLHDLDRLVRDTSDSIALSAPALDAERTQHEPSAVFIEVAAAVGRPDIATGKQPTGYPKLAFLQRTWFEPARCAAAVFRTETPLTAAAWQDRVTAIALAAPRVAVPASWTGQPELDLARISALMSATATPGAMDGLLGNRVLLPRLPGLGPERAISASSVGSLLNCPHHFLYENVLGWRSPSSPPSAAAIDPMPYGTLFHQVAEDFFREHGDQFLANASTLGNWLARADAIVERAFDELASAYPLSAESVRQGQRDRLRTEFHEFLRHEIEDAGRVTFAAVERAFGYPTPVRLTAGRLALHVHGHIDRIDRRGSTTIVRDLKTGKAKPRQGDLSGPTHTVDVQLGLYGIVTKALAAQWGLPDQVEAAYRHVSGRGEPERAFRDDFDALEEATSEWLRIAACLLADAQFPRTTEANDCRYCPFQPVCGTNAQVRASLVLEGATGVLGEFRDLKAPGDDE